MNLGHYGYLKIYFNITKLYVAYCILLTRFVENKFEYFMNYKERKQKKILSDNNVARHLKRLKVAEICYQEMNVSVSEDTKRPSALPTLNSF